MEMLTKKLGDICHLITDGKHGNCKDHLDSGYYFVSCKDVKDGQINYSEARQITVEDFKETDRRTQFAAGDILITNSGTIGRMCLAKDLPETRRTTFQKSVAIIKANNELVTSVYLYYYLLSEKDRLCNFAGGAAQKNLLLSDMRNFDVAIPKDKLLQKNWASKVRSYDLLIENNNRRIAILEDMAQSLYREWFVNFRYPNHQDNVDSDGKPKRIDSPLGKIPEGWEIKEFSTSIDFWNGTKCVSSESGEYDLYGANGIIGKAEGWKYENAVIIGRVGAYCGAVEYCFDRFWGSDNTIIAKCKSEKNIAYLFSMLEYFNLNKFAGGSAQPLLTQTTLKQLKYIAPPENLVEQFELIVHKLFESVVNLKKRNKNLKQQRDMLLPKLISGQIEL